MKNNTTTNKLLTLVAAVLFSAPAFAEKPYVSEMPDTIGQGNHQLEYAIDYTRPRHLPALIDELSVTAHDLSYTYGVGDKIDLSINIPFDNFHLKAEYPYNHILNEDDTQLQDLEIAAKAAYYKSQALELGAKLTVSLPTGDEKHFNSRRSAGKSNVTLISAHRLNLTEKANIHHNFVFATRNKKGAKNTSEISNTIGGTYQFNPHMNVVVDAGYTFDTRDSDANARFAAIGGQYIYQKTKVGLGFRVSRGGNEIEHSYNLGFQQVF